MPIGLLELVSIFWLGGTCGGDELGGLLLALGEGSPLRSLRCHLGCLLLRGHFHENGHRDLTRLVQLTYLIVVRAMHYIFELDLFHAILYCGHPGD